MRDSESMQDNNRLFGIETQLREILTHIKSPPEQLNLMQLRVAAYKKIRLATEHIDRVLEMIETEFITEAPTVDELPSLIFLNKQQEEEHNSELKEIADQLREIRWLLISPPENYQKCQEG